jgi:hypothetical protein
LDLLLKDITIAIQLHRFTPIIKAAGDKHLVRRVWPILSHMRETVAVSHQIHKPLSVYRVPTFASNVGATSLVGAVYHSQKDARILQV